MCDVVSKTKEVNPQSLKRRTNSSRSTSSSSTFTYQCDPTQTGIHTIHQVPHNFQDFSRKSKGWGDVDGGRVCLNNEIVTRLDRQ